MEKYADVAEVGVSKGKSGVRGVGEAVIAGPGGEFAEVTGET